MSPTSKYFNQTAWRTLAVLEVLGRVNAPLSLAELSRELDCSKSSLFTIVKTMEDAGYVIPGEANTSYALSPKIYGIVLDFVAHQSPVRAFNQASVRIVGAARETMQMAVLDGTDVVYVAKQESDHPIRLVSDVGQRLPSHATALGKCLLADLPSEEVRARYEAVEMSPMTPRTIRSLAVLIDTLENVKLTGVAEDWQEVSEGLCCVAAPVRDGTGRTVAAVSFSVPLHRATPDHWMNLRRVIVDAAAELSRTLGYEGTLPNALQEAIP